MMRAQKIDGSFFYSIDGFGKMNRLFYRPSDLGLWFLWALCEYVFATRDFGFLEASVPYYPLNKCRYASVWDHAKKSFCHLISKVGTGGNGHLKIRLSDWNDEMTWLAGADNPLDIVMTILKGESILNTAMACFILPMFEDLAGYAGDTKIKETSANLLSALKAALNRAWYKDHLIRSYSGLGKTVWNGRNMAGASRLGADCQRKPWRRKGESGCKNNKGKASYSIRHQDFRFR